MEKLRHFQLAGYVWAFYLSHTDEGHIDRAVAVGMVLAEHFADDTRALLVRAAVEIAEFPHAVKDASVDGFEAVPHVGQGTGYDDGHRIVDVTLLHLLLDVHFDYSLLIFHLVFRLVCLKPGLLVSNSTAKVRKNTKKSKKSV